MYVPQLIRLKKLYFHQFSLNYIIQMFWIYLPAAASWELKR